MLSKPAIPRQRPHVGPSSTPAFPTVRHLCVYATPRPCWFQRHLPLTGGRGNAIQSYAQGLTLQLAPPETQSTSSDALVRVASLASAWAKVSRRLTEAEDVPDLVIKAIRMALVWLEGAPSRRDGRDPFSRTVQLAVTLAELAAVGLPLCSQAIAAACLADASSAEGNTRPLDHSTIRHSLGDTVATLVHDILRVRAAPQRVELFDDKAASAIREWCIASHDVRACVVEVVSRLDELQNMSLLPMYERQQLALEALQVYAPLGHALGMGAVSAAMEDICFQVLFPESYMHTSEWLRTVVDPAEAALYQAQQQLLNALDTHPRFNQLASRCILRARTKSLFSMFKKLLRLGDMSKGGRKPAEVFDLLGMRAVVQPRTDLPPEEAEQAAKEACYIVQQVAEQLWSVVPGRTKDYIRRPKANGYSGIHLTVCMQSVIQSNNGCSGVVPTAGDLASASGSKGPDQGQAKRKGSKSPYLELQIRTQTMDDRAETGDAAHTAYKGGLDSRQARQLQAWSQELRQRLAFKPQGKLLLPPSVVAQQTGAYSVLDSIDIDADLLPTMEPEQTYTATLTTTTSTHTTTITTTTTTTSQEVRTALAAAPSPSPATSSATPSAMQQDSGKRRFNPAISQLFRFMDRNGDGRLSLDELKEQLREVTTSPPSNWLTSPYGAISFDPVADMSAMSWGSSGSMWGDMGMSGGEGLGAARAMLPQGVAGMSIELDEVLREVVGKEGGEVESLSLDEFAAFIKHVTAMRKEGKKKVQQQQREQQWDESDL